MFNLTIRTWNMALDLNGEQTIKYSDKATARAMADIYLECEDVYCVEMVNARTGELLFYEMKN